MTQHHSAESHAHHVVPPSVYVKTLLALLVLTAITVAASYVHWGSSAANVTIAVTIATLKASLVALFFMHLRYDKPLNAFIFVGGIFFLGFLMLFTFIDDFSRINVYPTQTPDKLTPIYMKWKGVPVEKWLQQPGLPSPQPPQPAESQTAPAPSEGAAH